MDYKWWRLINFMSDPQRVPLFGGILPMAVTDVRNKDPNLNISLVPESNQLQSEARCKTRFVVLSKDMKVIL